MKSKLPSKWVLVGVSFFLGIILTLGIRIATYRTEPRVHYHANFAVYINGQQEQFKNPMYYTEIEESCTENGRMTPHERAHMHDNINNVVHVEDSAVTWGQFFQNLGWVVDPGAIRSADNLYLPDAQNNITFMLNGQPVDNVVRTVISDQDRLLVNYGSQATDSLQTKYKTVPSTAHNYDVTQDPKSCSGHKQTTMRDRMRHMF